MATIALADGPHAEGVSWLSRPFNLLAYGESLGC